VPADALALAQIFANLLGNAVAYLDPSRPGVLTITAVQHPERTAFAVQDHGRGIAAAALPHIFEPFRRVGRQDVPGANSANTSSLFRTFGECLEALPEMAGRGHRRLLPRSDRWPVGSRCRPLPPISC
jgi:light-regulated signal transduction histidine kinase (bacteriophytochrome)